MIPLGRNVGRLALFNDQRVFSLVKGRPFVYTDPDVVPDDQCPLNAIAYFEELLERHVCSKVGFGLRIDDLPRHCAHRDVVTRWESQFWREPGAPGIFRAPIDTTFALYPGSTVAFSYDAIRT